MAFCLNSSLVRPAFLSRTRTQRMVCSAADRQTWYPGAVPAKHLDGSLAGDFGFDPLNLGKDPAALKWYVEGELTNGRWSMLAVAGILLTDATGLPKFWEAGAKVNSPFDFTTLVLVEIALFAFLEGSRYEAFKSGKAGLFPLDPMKMTSPDTQLKEVKNGRLAMLAFIGFFMQYAVQGKGPIDCLLDHIADPWHNNVYTSRLGPEFTAIAIILAILPITIEAQNNLSKGSDEGSPSPFGLFLLPALAAVLAIHFTSFY